MSSGYTRQSAAEIIPSAVVKSSSFNSELNKLRDAFDFSTDSTTGHTHDGSSDQGSYVPLIADVDGNNKAVVSTTNNRIEFYVSVSDSPVEQVRLQDGAIVPVTTNDVDLGASAAKFKDLHLAGDATVGGTITSTGGFTGDVTGDTTGNVTGNVTGNLTGNVTASSGSSTFENVTINGTIDVTNTPIVNVADPTLAQHATTKAYVDAADDLKLNLSGGTMSGAIAMGTSKITGLGDPTVNQDAATKIYVDQADDLKLSLTGGTMSGAIAMGTSKITGLGDPTLTQDAATKNYVDTQVSGLVDAAPGALDTLNELAAALGDDPDFATTVTDSIATKLPLAGGTMSGAINMGTTNKITDLATPTAGADATTKTYVDTADALKVAKAGDTLSGDLAFGGNKATGLGVPTASGDATTKTYVDTADALKVAKAGDSMTGALAMGSNKITGLGTPTTGTDATTKAYVDGILGSATAASDSADAAALSASNAASSYDQFDDRYLGSKASDPSVDNDGDALLTGALYWNTVDNQLKVYDGAAWNDAAFDLSGIDSDITTFSLPANTTISTFGASLVDDADAETARTTLGLGSSVALDGSTEVYITLEQTYTITDYSTFSTYSVAATSGTATISGDTITYTAPGTDGTDTLTVTRDGVAVAFSITILPVAVDAPTLTVEGSPTDVPETPTLTTGAFATTPTGQDTHASTNWIVRLAADDSIVYQSLADTVNLLSIEVPDGNLLENTEYKFQVQHIGVTYGASAVTEVVATTVDSYGPTVIGQAFGGGFYAGNIVEGGTEYYVIVAPKASGESSSQQFKTTNTASPAATQTLNDGPAATAAMVSAGSHPAAAFCDGLTIGGFSDWYLPARDELELLYRNLKPTTDSNNTGGRSTSSITYPEGDDLSADTHGVNRNSSPTGAAYTSGDPAQTSVTDFIDGGTEAFASTYYWSSSEFSDTFAWFQGFGNGYQPSNDKALSFYVRAVRRLPV